MLNEMVYEVYRPPLDEQPELEIYFFHGLQLKYCKEAHITTWMSFDNLEFWPQTWLAKAFPKARILTVLYDSTAKRTEENGRVDMFCSVENLLSWLINDHVRLRYAPCPIVLVGHCLGGLLLKELCVYANEMVSENGLEAELISNFFDNIRGMFFYATPHIGSKLDQLPDSSDGALRGEITRLKESTARRTAQFNRLKLYHKWLTYGFGETCDSFVDCLGKYIRVVSEASSRTNMDEFYSGAGDHFNICKPKGEDASAFICLRNFLDKVLKEALLESKTAADGRGYIVDMYGRAKKVEKMLVPLSAHTLFIVGLRAIGKTTLAQQVFHDISHKFHITCFVELDNIEGRSDNSKQFLQTNENKLKQEVLKKIQNELKQRDRSLLERENFNVPNYLKNKKVLLILDNVQSQCQLDVLESKIWLEGSSSRLIVTTPTPRLASKSPTFRVELLEEVESVQLFLHYAFKDKPVARHTVQTLYTVKSS